MPQGATAWNRWTDFVGDLLVDGRVVISVVTLTLFAVGHLMFRSTSAGFASASSIDAAGVVLIAAGVGWRSWAAGYLRKGCDLTTKGPYSLCRHPLYVGSLLMFVGFAVVLHWWNYLPSVALLLTLVYGATVLREERRLEQKFGPRWRTYAAATPRFIPWRFSRYVAGIWDVRQWIRSREYRAAAVAGFTTCAWFAARLTLGF